MDKSVGAYATIFTAEKHDNKTSGFYHKSMTAKRLISPPTCISMKGLQVYNAPQNAYSTLLAYQPTRRVGKTLEAVTQVL